MTTTQTKGETMATYEIIIKDRTARVFKAPGPFGGKAIMSDAFTGPTYKQDAIKWLKKGGGKDATFRFIQH